MRGQTNKKRVDAGSCLPSLSSSTISCVWQDSTPSAEHVLHIHPSIFPLGWNPHPLIFVLLFISLMAGRLNFDPALSGQAVLLLVSLVVVPVARGVATVLALVGLLPRVAQHVALEVHALVAAVAAERALEGLDARVDALVAFQVGQVAAGIVTQVALVGLLARVHAVVAFQVVKVCRSIVALRALVGLLATVRLHVAGQVVGVVGEEGADGAGVHLVTALAGAAGGGRVFGQHLQGALGPDLGRRAVLVLQDHAAQSAGVGEEQWGERVTSGPCPCPAPAVPTSTGSLQEGWWWALQKWGGTPPQATVESQKVAIFVVGPVRVQIWSYSFCKEINREGCS